MATNRPPSSRPYTARALTEQQRKEYKQAFRLFDVSGKNRVNVKDLRKIMKKLNLHPSETELKDMIANVDRDGSNTIGFDDFLNMMLKQGRTEEDKGEEMKAAFKIFDKNGDGFISRDEFISTMQMIDETTDEKSIDAMIKAADLNKDGKINYAEFIAALAK